MDPQALVREPTRTGQTEPEEGVAIALSGGGYRAMLFHLGVLWRLGQLGFFTGHVLQRNVDNSASAVGPLQRISSVSGGSIVAARFALAYTELSKLAPTAFDAPFLREVVTPVRTLAATTIAGHSAVGKWQVIKDVLLPGSVNQHVADALDRNLYGGKSLQDLPDNVRFVLNASNLQSGALWRFSKPFMRDWKVGEVQAPRLRLADAVSASSAFPPVLAPAVLRLDAQAFTPNSGDLLQRPPYTTTPTLADGGVYDNLGLETCFKRYRTLFVSNASAPFEAEPEISRNWASVGARCIDVMDNQVLSQRKRLLIDALKTRVREGAFWDIQQDIGSYPCAGKLPCPALRTLELAHVRTDMEAKDPELQERLINWGYAVSDAAVRSWFNTTYPAPATFPYPSRGV